MSPLTYATRLAESEDYEDKVIAVAMVARGLSDADPSDPFRLPWPVATSVAAAIRYLRLTETRDLIERATDAMPRLPAFLLNRPN